MVFLVLCFAAAAVGADPAWYTRQGSWQETMRASREALAAREAGDPHDAQVEMGPFYRIGPFKEPGKCSFEPAFPPEKEIDLAKSYGPLKWQLNTEAEEVVHEIPFPVPDAAMYFYRRIVAPRDMDLQTFYGSDDGLAVWCNGKKVIDGEFDLARGGAGVLGGGGGGFCRWLSQTTGKGFALPTEAQWEWACRAGTETPLSFGRQACPE